MTRLRPEGEAIQVWGPAERPAGFHWRGTTHRIADVWNCWRLHTRWWEPDQTVWREYLKVTTDQEVLCLLYRDLVSGDWFLARIYD